MYCACLFVHSVLALDKFAFFINSLPHIFQITDPICLYTILTLFINKLKNSATLQDEVWSGIKIFLLLITERRNQVSSQWKYLMETTLTRQLKVNVTNNQTNWAYLLLIEKHIIYVVFLPIIWISPWGNIRHIPMTGLYASEISKSWKTKKNRGTVVD